jgi:outer membrane protein
VTDLPPLPPYIPGDRTEVESQAARHPELLVAQREEKAANHAIDTRIATLLPKVSLEGSLEDRNGLTQINPVANSIREDALFLRVSIPIFQSGAEYARIREARHQFARAHQLTADATLSTKANALKAWADFQAAKLLLTSSQMANNAAAKALSGIQKEYDYGTRTTFDILDTQQEYYASRTDLIHARTEYILSAYRLLAAVGMLNPKTLNLPVASVTPKVAKAEPKTVSYIEEVSSEQLAVPGIIRKETRSNVQQKDGRVLLGRMWDEGVVSEHTENAVYTERKWPGPQ